jgi:hypothetical protein
MAKKTVKRKANNNASASKSTKKSSSDSKNQSRGPVGPRRELFPSRGGMTPKTDTMARQMRKAGVKDPGIYARNASGKPDQQGLTYQANKAGVLNNVVRSNKKSSYSSTKMTSSKTRPVKSKARTRR